MFTIHAAASCVHHSGSKLPTVHGWRAIEEKSDSRLTTKTNQWDD
jgi:hypothetical protein